MNDLKDLPKSPALRKEALEELSLAAMSVGSLLIDIIILGHFGMAKDSHNKFIRQINLVNIMIG